MVQQEVNAYADPAIEAIHEIGRRAALETKAPHGANDIHNSSVYQRCIEYRIEGQTVERARICLDLSPLCDAARAQGRSQSSIPARFIANGNVSVQTNEMGLAITNSYDGLNRLTNVAYPDGTSVAYVYDKLYLVGVRKGGSPGAAHSLGHFWSKTSPTVNGSPTTCAANGLWPTYDP